MRKLLLLHSHTFLLSMLVLHSVRSDHPNCQLFYDLAQKFTEEDQFGSLILSCNSTCSQITCSGLLHSQTGFCFGLRLNYCDQPVTVDLYVALPDQNISLEKTIAPRNGTQKISGDLNRSDKRKQIVLEAAMMQVNCSYIYLGIGGQVNVDDISENITIFPNTYLNLPPCEDNCAQKTTFKATSVCSYPNPSTPKSQGKTTMNSTPATSGTTEAKPTTVSKDSTTVKPTTVSTKRLTDSTAVKPTTVSTKLSTDNTTVKPTTVSTKLSSDSTTEKPTTVPTKLSTGNMTEKPTTVSTGHTKVKPITGSIGNTTAKPTTVSTGSKTYNTSCSPGLDNCSLNERCSMKDGVCLCNRNSSFHPEIGTCQPDKAIIKRSATEEILPTHQACPAKPVDCPKPAASETQREVIIGSVVVGVVFVVGAAVLYLKKRRKQHTLLSDQDDDQEMVDLQMGDVPIVKPMQVYIQL